jgi:hypothetical protein
MANKRTQKKIINQVCEALFTECIAASLYGAGGPKENADAMLVSIVRMHDDFIRRVSHPEPGMPPRKYFKHLRDSFAAQVSEVIDQINTL